MRGIRPVDSLEQSLNCPSCVASVAGGLIRGVNGAVAVTGSSVGEADGVNSGAWVEVLWGEERVAVAARVSRGDAWISGDSSNTGEETWPAVQALIARLSVKRRVAMEGILIMGDYTRAIQGIC
jgi:hypothetical protein